MTDSTTCQQARGLIFERRRDQLTELQEMNLQEHLQSCARCSGLFHRTDDALRAAADPDPSTFTDLDPDDLFQEIASTLDDPTSVEARLDDAFEEAADLAPRTFGPIDDDATFDAICDQVEEADAPASSRRWPIFAAAAALLLIAAGSLLLLPSDEPPAPSESFTSLSSPSEFVHLYRSESTSYDMDSDDHRITIDIHRGSIVADRLPGSDIELIFRAQSHTITTQGTAFSVTVEGDVPEVQLFEGQLLIEPPDAGPVELHSGQRFDHRGVTDLDPASRSRVQPFVDLDAHRKYRDLQTHRHQATHRGQEHILSALDGARAGLSDLEDTENAEETEVTEVTDPSATPPDDPSPEPAPPSTRELRIQALDALHSDQPDRAADLLNQALDQAPSKSEAQADILLELARLQIHHLDQPLEAATTLHRFLNHWPDDPAADAIADHLCELNIDVDGDDICP